MRTQPLVISGLIIAATIQTIIVVSPAIPLGIPGEWVWRRHELPEQLVSAVSQFSPAVLGISVLLFVAFLGNRHLFGYQTQSRSDRNFQQHGPSCSVTGLLLFALVFGTWVWLKTVERCAPAPHRNLKSLWVLYDPASSGYFYEANFRIRSTPEFLASYTERIQGEVLHMGTHPPGLFLLNRWIIQFCRVSPGIAERIRPWISRDDAEVFRSTETSTYLARENRILDNAEFVALFLTSELTTLATALTVIPLYFLIRHCFDALVAWRTACLWATLPCLVVFLPKSDVLYAMTALSAMSLGVTSLSSHAKLPYRLMSAVLGGLILWFGLMLSLAHLPVAALLGVLFVIRSLRQLADKQPEPQTELSVNTLAITVLAGTAVAATAAFTVAMDCNLLTVWKTNLLNHSGFYDQYTRTAWKWMIVNPFELGMAAGLPLTLAALTGFGMGCIHTDVRQQSRTLPIDLSVAVVITIGALWLSARNSGEAARLWCFLTPWLLIPAAHLFQAELKNDGTGGRPVIWWSLMLTQMFVCILTSGRVSGFSF
ncbi:MAG: hypothetical protein MK110_11630 [Fuerstiella sp.]|nr:hypothetical protein [Fuerstiella sp.]